MTLSHTLREVKKHASTSWTEYDGQGLWVCRYLGYASLLLFLALCLMLYPTVPTVPTVEADERVVGKMTGNDDKIRQGHEKKQAATHHPQNKEDHAGISYTKSGGMKQKCMGPPPSWATADSDSDQAGQGDGQEGKGKEVQVDETASTHQHGDYTGPNLTSPPPEHYHPHHDLDPIFVGLGARGSGGRSPEDPQDRRGRQEEEGAGGGLEVGGYDLHGGFPTGAPSPGLGRGKQVLDPFDQIQVKRSGTGTVVEAGQ